MEQKLQCGARDVPYCSGLGCYGVRLVINFDFIKMENSIISSLLAFEIRILGIPAHPWEQMILGAEALVIAHLIMVKCKIQFPIYILHLQLNIIVLDLRAMSATGG